MHLLPLINLATNVVALIAVLRMAYLLRNVKNLMRAQGQMLSITYESLRIISLGKKAGNPQREALDSIQACGKVARRFITGKKEVVQQ